MRRQKLHLLKRMYAFIDSHINFKDIFSIVNIDWEATLTIVIRETMNRSYVAGYLNPLIIW